MICIDFFFQFLPSAKIVDTSENSSWRETQESPLIMSPLFFFFLTFKIIIQESNCTDSVSMRNVKEITCGCDTCTCIAWKSQRMCRKIGFPVLKKIGKVFSPTEKHNDSYRNTKTQTLDKQVYCKEGNQMRKGICYVLEWRRIFLFE